MLFENLVVDRIILHEVYRRLDDRQPITPAYGNALLHLDADAIAMFRDRIVSAVGSQSQCMEMVIINYAAGSSLEIARDLILAPDDEVFIQHSRRFADKLTEVQISRSLPGGVLIVFKGQAGNPSEKIIGVIKAETHSGFRRTREMQVEFFKDLFLTPQTKLYKIGLFNYGRQGDPILSLDGWGATIYDAQMTSAHRESAAKYFYELFLGCGFPVNAAALTKQFYDGTREFINKINVSDESRADLLTGLYTYLKVDQSPVVELSTFAQNYLTDELKDDYSNFMVHRAFPTIAVAKDTSDLTTQLRRRKLKFSRDVQLSAPPDAFADLVSVRTIEGEPDAVDGGKPVWTQITIKDRVREQE